MTIRVTSTPLKVRYRNWRGETRVREIIPLTLSWGKTEWHPEEQLLLQARDLEDNIVKHFALKDCDFLTPKSRGAPFHFEAPAWLNTERVQTAEEGLNRAEELASAFYAAGVQTGVHSMIEWCGVMGEYVKMLGVAHAQGVDVREVDQHCGTTVDAPEFMVDYFTEKLKCQLVPFIRGNPALWRRAIDRWFQEAEVDHS